jgi:hypothetical protein
LGSFTWVAQPAFAAWTIGDPIVTYWAGPGEFEGPLTATDAALMADVGMNVVWANSPAEVDIAGQYGLRAMYENRCVLTPANAGPGLNSLVDSLKNNPALYGYFLSDEPSASEFNALSSLASYLRNRDPNHIPYINLFPRQAWSSTLGASNYQAYLNQYITTLNPELLSYDNYQFMASEDSGHYLINLQEISAAAKSAGIPFMNSVQASSWDSSVRVPTPNQERFLAYTTLAYGAQGISYFVWNRPGVTGGIVNSDDTPTAIYSTLKVVNRQFVAIAKQYKSLNAIGTYLKGYRSSRLPPGTNQLTTTSPFDISSVTNTASYATGAALQGVLFGFFDKDGTTLADATMALVVNLDYSNSKTYTLTGPGLLSVFDATTGVWNATGKSSVALTFEPGGGWLVGLTSVVPEPSAIVLLSIGLTGLFAYRFTARSWCASAIPHRRS